MARVTKVPVTPEVLDWAITESGYTLPELADAAGVDLDDLNAWLQGKARPGVTAALRTADDSSSGGPRDCATLFG